MLLRWHWKWIYPGCRWTMISIVLLHLPQLLVARENRDLPQSSVIIPTQVPWHRWTIGKTYCQGFDGEAGICMFKWDCIRQDGQMMASCRDGFLLGVCCKLPTEQSTSEMSGETMASEEDNSITTPVTSEATSTTTSTTRKPLQTFGINQPHRLTASGTTINQVLIPTLRPLIPSLMYRPPVFLTPSAATPSVAPQQMPTQYIIVRRPPALANLFATTPLGMLGTLIRSTFQRPMMTAQTSPYFTTGTIVTTAAIPTKERTKLNSTTTPSVSENTDDNEQETTNLANKTTTVTKPSDDLTVQSSDTKISNAAVTYDDSKEHKTDVDLKSQYSSTTHHKPHNAHMSTYNLNTIAEQLQDEQFSNNPDNYPEFVDLTEQTTPSNWMTSPMKPDHSTTLDHRNKQTDPETPTQDNTPVQIVFQHSPTGKPVSVSITTKSGKESVKLHETTINFNENIQNTDTINPNSKPQTTVFYTEKMVNKPQETTQHYQNNLIDTSNTYSQKYHSNPNTAQTNYHTTQTYHNAHSNANNPYSTQHHPHSAHHQAQSHHTTPNKPTTALSRVKYHTGVAYPADVQTVSNAKPTGYSPSGISIAAYHTHPYTPSETTFHKHVTPYHKHSLPTLLAFDTKPSRLESTVLDGTERYPSYPPRMSTLPTTTVTAAFNSTNGIILPSSSRLPPTVALSTPTRKPTSSTKTSTSKQKKPTSTKKPISRLSSTSAITTEKPKSIKSTAKSTTTEKPRKKWDYRKDCGVRPLRPQGRIVGGKNSFFGEWPWQVLIKEATWLGLFVKNKCGGVLISNRYILTAAHCQPGFLSSLVALLGEHDLSTDFESLKPEVIPVKRMILHRNYNAATFENDLALLELERPITLRPHIVPICLPEKNEDFTGKQAYVTGWGKTSHGGAVPNVLQYVQVPVLRNQDCQRMFMSAGHVKVIRDYFVCAGYERGVRDSCEGDSGGPLTILKEDGRWALVGTVSHGIRCAEPNLPGVYMRIASYRTWIDSIINSKNVTASQNHTTVIPAA